MGGDSIATARTMDSESSINTMSTLPESEIEEIPRLFLPDGSPDIKLRDTVRNALRVSRFDSISTLLAEGPMPGGGSSGGLQKQSQSSSKGGVRGMRLSRSGSSKGGKMVSVMKSGKKRAARGSRSPKKRDKGPPAIYDVSHSGLDLGGGKAEAVEGDGREHEKGASDQALVCPPVTKRKKKEKRNKICFGCWVAGSDRVKHCELHPNEQRDVARGDDSLLMCSNWDVSTVSLSFTSHFFETKRM